jgi:hypothetical protein
MESVTPLNSTLVGNEADVKYRQECLVTDDRTM